jgi:hypothetical protein
MLMMKRAFQALALALSAAVGIVPVALNLCLMTCQASADGSSPTRAAPQHSCHQTSQAESFPRWHGDSKPCGHDHSNAASLVGAAPDAGRQLKMQRTPVASLALASSPLRLASVIGIPPLGPSRNSFAAASFPLPLRI